MAQRTVYAVIENDRAAFGVYADRPQNARIALADIKSLARRVLSFPRRDEFVEHIPASFCPPISMIDHIPPTILGFARINAECRRQNWSRPRPSV
jgi:hypothetical protein